MLLMRQGPAVTGLYFQRVYKYYRPIFVCYPLWRRSLKDCMGLYIFHHVFRDNRNLQLDIPFMAHQELFPAAITYVQEQSHNLLQDNIKIRNILTYHDYLRKYDLLVINQNFIGKKALLVHSMMIALYVNSPDLIQWACNECEKQALTWNQQDFERFEGETINSWKLKLYHLIDQRDEIMERIRVNSMDKRFAKLKESHLIL